MKKWQVAIYVTIALAAIALIWWIFGGLIASIFGVGGGAVVQQLVKVDQRHQQASEQIEQDRAQAQREEQQRRKQVKEGLRLKAAEGAAKDNINIGLAKRQEDLHRLEREEADRLMREIDEPGGFVRISVCAILIAIAMLGMMLTGGSARGATASAADKAHTTKILTAMRKARYKIKELKAEIQSLKRQHQIALTACHKQRRASAKMCSEKVLALSARRCPPTWPWAVGMAGAFIGGGALGYGIGRVAP